MVEFTSGNLDNHAYRIADNVGDYIFTEENINDDETSYGAASVNDTFAIYQDHISKTFTGGLYRYARISITPYSYGLDSDDFYYKLGSMVLERASP